MITSLSLLAQTLSATTTAAATTAATQPTEENVWVLYGWWTLGIISFLFAAIFSGSEIGIYSLSRVRLRLRTAKGEHRALLLQQWLEKPTYAIEGLLILQNIAGFGVSAAFTGMLSFYGYPEWAQALISIAVVTPMILLFADLVPKDLFHTHTDSWTYKVVPLLKWSFKLITLVPLLPLVRALSWLSLKVVGRRKEEEKAMGPRSEIVALFQESAATGVLSGTQQDLVQRALRLARISVREIMIPWNRVVGVPASISLEGFRALVKRYNVSRLPVLGKSTTEVLGIVDVLDALSMQASALSAGGAGTSTGFRLGSHLKPVMTLIGEQSVRSAITLMQRARQTAAVVVDRNGRAIGLVTMKDLVEELVGDLENW